MLLRLWVAKQQRFHIERRHVAIASIVAHRHADFAVIQQIFDDLTFTIVTFEPNQLPALYRLPLIVTFFHLRQVADGQIADGARLFAIFRLAIRQYRELHAFQRAAFLYQVTHAVAVHPETNWRAVRHRRTIRHVQIANTLPGRLAQVNLVGHAVEEVVGGIFRRPALRVKAVGDVTIMQLIEVTRRPLHVLFQLFAGQLIHGNFAARILIVKGDIFCRNGAHIQFGSVVINLQGNHLRLRRIVAAGFLIQLANTGVLNMDLRNAFHRIRRHQILASQLRDRPIGVGVGAQDFVVRLIDLFQRLV